MRVAIIGKMKHSLPFYIIQQFDSDEVVNEREVAEYDIVFIGKCRDIENAQKLAKLLAKDIHNVFIQNMINTTIIDELGAGLC